MLIFDIITYLYYTRTITANDIILLACLNKNMKKVIYGLKLNNIVKINLAHVDEDATIIKYFNCCNIWFQESIIFDNRFPLFNNIRKIIFDDCKTVTDETLEQISRFDLHTLAITQQNMRFSLSSLTNNPTTLIFDIYINEENMEYISDNKYVKSLDLTHCTISPDIECVLSCIQLEHLELQNTLPINISLKNLINLKFLNLMNADISNGYLKCLPNNLETLILSNTDIDSLDNLECFNLTELHIDRTAIREIKNIHQFTELTKLCINYAVEVDNELVYCCKPDMQNDTIQNLSKLTNLSVLDISGCIEHENQLKFLCTLHLDELYVNNVQLTRIGLTYLHNAKQIFFSHRSP